MQLLSIKLKTLQTYKNSFVNKLLSLKIYNVPELTN